MNKQCKSCGTAVDAQARFCHVCGGTDFVVSGNQGTPVQPAQPVYQPPVQQPVQPVYQPPVQPPKKSNVGLIIGIVAGALVVLGGIGFAAQSILQSQDYGDGGTDAGYEDDADIDVGNDDPVPAPKDDDDTPPAKVAYTKGTFDGSVYVNEWANIKLTMPLGYSNASASEYASIEGSNVDCGAYFKSNDTTQLIQINFETLPAFSSYTEESYLDIVMPQLRASTDVTYTTPDSYSSFVVAGAVYTKATCSFVNDYGNFYHTIYVRKIDDRMVVIAVMSPSAITNDTLAKSIYPAN